jgi:hypothetical protein
MLPHECPAKQIQVYQLANSWKVVQRDRPIKDHDKLSAALTYAVEQVKTAIKEGEQQPLTIVVTPPASPWMRE